MLSFFFMSMFLLHFLFKTLATIWSLALGLASVLVAVTECQKIRQTSVLYLPAASPINRQTYRKANNSSRNILLVRFPSSCNLFLHVITDAVVSRNYQLSVYSDGHG